MLTRDKRPLHNTTNNTNTTTHKKSNQAYKYTLSALIQHSKQNTSSYTATPPQPKIIYIMHTLAQQTIHNIHYAPFTTRYSPPAFPDFLTHTPQQHFFIFIHTNHPCKTSQPTQPNHNITTIPQCKPNTKSQQTNITHLFAPHSRKTPRNYT